MSKELVELINVFHVVLLLKGDVNNCGGNVLANAVKEFSLADDDLQLGVEVDLEDVHALRVNVDSQDVLVEHLDGLNGVLGLPVVELDGFVVLGQLLSDADVVLGSLTTSRDLGENLGLGGELVDGGLDASNDTTRPSDATGAGRHVFGNWSVSIIFGV